MFTVLQQAYLKTANYSRNWPENCNNCYCKCCLPWLQSMSDCTSAQLTLIRTLWYYSSNHSQLFSVLYSTVSLLPLLKAFLCNSVFTMKVHNIILTTLLLFLLKQSKRRVLHMVWNWERYSNRAKLHEIDSTNSVKSFQFN